MDTFIETTVHIFAYFRKYVVVPQELTRVYRVFVCWCHKGLQGICVLVSQGLTGINIMSENFVQCKIL